MMILVCWLSELSVNEVSGENDGKGSQEGKAEEEAGKSGKG